MLRYYLHLILIPVLLFTAILILIHAQPYDDHELRELLLPEDCPAPCFMGIRPDVTTTDEALKTLENSGWATQITHEYSDTISWSWNGNQTKFLNSDAMSFINSYLTVD